MRMSWPDWRTLLLFITLLLPFLWILQKIIRLQNGEWDILGPEPGKAVVWYTGTWAFNTLLMTLAATPLRRWLAWQWPLRHRRMLGLFTFFYLTLHLCSYFAFLLEWHWQELGAEIVKRPYLLLGMAGWLLMLPLAITSTKGWQRRLRRNWKTLHKLIYLITVLAAVHYLLQIRSSWFEPVLYAVLAMSLLMTRLRWKKSA